MRRATSTVPPRPSAIHVEHLLGQVEDSLGGLDMGVVAEAGQLDGIRTP
jgi:hypothetical protein